MSYYKYRVLYKKVAEKFLLSNKKEGLKFYKAFQELTESNENVKKYDIKKYRCSNDYTYRLRIGSYKAVFEVHQDKVIIIVIYIGSRGDVYKNIKR